MGAISEAVGLVGGIAGLIILFTGAFVFIKGSYSKARIDALRQDNADLRNRVGDLESADARHEQNEERLQQEIDGLRVENKMLTDMVTQRANVEAMSDMLDFHHKEAMASWSKIYDALKDMGGK